MLDVPMRVRELLQPCSHSRHGPKADMNALSICLCCLIRLSRFAQGWIGAPSPQWESVIGLWSSISAPKLLFTMWEVQPLSVGCGEDYMRK